MRLDPRLDEEFGSIPSPSIVPNTSPSNIQIATGSFSGIAGAGGGDDVTAAEKGSKFKLARDKDTGKLSLKSVVTVYAGPDRGFVEVDDDDERLFYNRRVARQSIQQNMDVARFLAQNGMGQSDAMRLAQRGAEDGNEIANGRRATSYYGNGGNSSMINQRNSRDFY